ncbi:Pyridoxal phosphate-dependent decarboxylase [Cordyceps fumosorosea ARSEF 2679]|uniref:Pyridoxal phosphate-dependent decarboxylase n=1 Tax=Cordyceps fumosorosea (strain ARSEF 2679) TaxID=1081104 RepID=A0A167RLI5_CORFA|nr:Pyridoxal phosphate-dependent decarboxylase [Cordyceps fumosorosea ARSEF 2679]OAA58714.1 Pyridoxal phosphate-dependent decarboxylase [Cordyceps fumosorosea ARSEF 2679]
MPASDHGSETECLPYTAPDGTIPGKTTLGRAEELDDLLSAVRDLIVPYVKAADDNAAKKHTGRLPRDAADRPYNVLVEPLPPRELVERMNFSLPVGEGSGRDGLLDTIQDLLKYSVNTWDQGWMDKLTASTNPVGVVSEMVLGVLNTNVHVYHVSPALTVVEKATGRALAGYFGFDGPHAGGVTCQGGSASNLTSLVIARNALYPDTRDNGSEGYKFVIFTSEASHYSIEKAAVACGMGAASCIGVPTDARGRMRVDALEQLVVDAKARGCTPLYVNATAGTTVMGAYDPIRDIKAVCDRHGLWLHVDGAWGGSVAFSRSHRHKLDGSALADSLTINPQKMLNVPMTCSFLLTNDLRRFHAANSLRAGYLFHDPEGEEVWDLADLTMQCGRRADSLKLALAWIYYGAAGFERGVDHAFAMAAHLADLVDKSPDFLLVSERPTPCLQICFYYAPGGRLAEDPAENTRRTRAMAERMVARGFMFDYAPGPKGHFFRVVANCQTQVGTMDGIFRGLSEVGKEAVSE